LQVITAGATKDASLTGAAPCLNSVEVCVSRIFVMRMRLCALVFEETLRMSKKIKWLYQLAVAGVR